MSTEYLNNKNFEKVIEQFQKTKREKFKCELLLSELIDTEARKKIRNVNLAREGLLLVEYKKLCEDLTFEFIESQKKLATAFYTLSEHIALYAKFNLIDNDDAIQEGVVICFEKIDRFDASKGKAFNYMTTCVLNHYRQLYRTARNYNELKKKFADHLHATSSRKMIKNKKDTTMAYGKPMETLERLSNEE